MFSADDPARDINYTAKFVGVSVKTIHRWRKKGLFPKGTLVVGKVYWLESTLMDWKKKTFGENNATT